MNCELRIADCELCRCGVSPSPLLHVSLSPRLLSQDFWHEDNGKQKPTSHARPNRAAVLAGKTETGDFRPIAFEHGSGVDQAFAEAGAPSFGADGGVEFVEKRADEFVIVVAPRVGGDDAAAGVVSQFRRQVELMIIDAEHDHALKWRRGLLYQQRWKASLVTVAFQIGHFPSAAGVDPGVEEVGVRRLSNGNHLAQVKTQLVRRLYGCGA